MRRKIICTVEDCAKPVLAKRLCPTHYFRMREHGRLDLLCRACGAVVEGRKAYCDGCREEVGKSKRRQYQSRPDVAKKRAEAKRDYRRRNADKVREAKRVYNSTQKARAAKKIRDRVQSSVRRARIRGTKTERFDPLDVLERDRWICQICGEKTLKSKRGTFHPCAPELDHIVPLASGGDHSRKNTQCSCRECNIKKGATVFGQLRMIG